MTQMIVPASKGQMQAIHMNIPKDIKEEWVQWATGDNSKISCKDLSFDQANKILEKNNLPIHKLAFWAKFDKENTQHSFILSLCIQYGWWKKSGKYRQIADLDELNKWLHSKSPVKKALMDMEPKELSKVIIALEKMTKKEFS